MNKMIEILEGDLIALGKFNKIYEVEYNGVDCYVCERCWDEVMDIDVIKDEITAIYRKQGKDYICIWEKE